MNDQSLDIDALALTEAEDIDFAAFSNDELLAIYAAYARTIPDFALEATLQLSKRSRRDAALKESTVALFEDSIVNGKVSDEVGAFATSCLYGLDRARGPAVIAKTIDSCSDAAVQEASEALSPDVQLYAGEPEFDLAVSQLGKRLTRDSKRGRALKLSEIDFLRTAGYPVAPDNELDAQGVDHGEFKAYYVEGEATPSIVIERVSNGAEAIRLEPIQFDGSRALACFDLLELGMRREHARNVIYGSVFENMCGGAYRSAQEVIYFDLSSETSVSRKYGVPDPPARGAPRYARE